MSIQTKTASNYAPDCQLSGTATVALITAFIAIGLSLLGTYSPWGALRVPLEQKLTGIWAVVAYGGTFVLPIFLGLGAAVLGGHSMSTIENSNGKLYGDGLGVFAILLGLFAVVIGSVCTFAGLIWTNI